MMATWWFCDLPQKRYQLPCWVVSWPEGRRRQKPRGRESQRESFCLRGVQSILRCKEFWFSISQIFRPLMAWANFGCYWNLECVPKTEMPLISKNHVWYPSTHKNFSERCHLLRNLLVNRNWSKAGSWSLYSRAAFSTSCPASLSFDQLSWGGVGLSVVVLLLSI